MKKRNPTITPDDEVTLFVLRHAFEATPPWMPASSKRFIADVYDQVERDGRTGGASLDEFKEVLVDLHRKGLVTLSRADLVAAMDPKKVRRSETTDRNATYHFVAHLIADVAHQNQRRRNPPVPPFLAPGDGGQTTHARVLDETHRLLRTYDAIVGANDRLAVVGRDPSQPAARRVTFFADDGPLGHVVVPSRVEAAEEIAESLTAPLRGMTVDEVDRWMQTPRFELGARKVAYVQALNTLSWLASKADRRDLFREAEDKAQAEIYGPRGAETVAAYDRAIEILTDAIRELPTPNPRAKALVRNPPWVTTALANHYEVIADKVPTRWLPQLAHVQARARERILAELVEYGCGAYGCVLATNDPRTVLKVTTDDTEVQFATELAPEMPAALCVEYRLVVRLSATRGRTPIHLLWRESAEHVGAIEQVAGSRALDLLLAQHVAGQRAYDAIMRRASGDEIERLAHAWIATVEQMRSVQALASLAKAISSAWERHRVLFGDIHEGNLGLVHRGDQQLWVITDPGHVAVISER